MCASSFYSKMRASSFCSKMHFKIEMGQTHFGPSQNKNGDQKGQMANPNGPSKGHKTTILVAPETQK